MALRISPSLALVGALGLLPACGDDSKETADDSATGGNPTGNTEPTGGGTDTPTGGATEDSALCTNFGGQAGVEAVITSFVGKVLVNESINAYFLSTDVDGGHLIECLSTQVGEAIQCAGTVYGCMDMKAAHAGMGISTNDFTDLAGDFSAAMDEVATLTATDKKAVLDVLGGMLPMIVEDEKNNVSIYQRVGRKPGINGLIGSPMEAKSFVALVAGDTTLLPFFATSDLARLKTCLVRQVAGATAGGSAIGPIYGKEVTAPAPADPGVTMDKPCLDMVTSHKDLVDDMGVGIEYADFGALVGHLITAMTNAGVTMDDQNAIAGVLGPLCSSIVTVDPEMCP